MRIKQIWSIQNNIEKPVNEWLVENRHEIIVVDIKFQMTCDDQWATVGAFILYEKKEKK